MIKRTLLNSREWRSTCLVWISSVLITASSWGLELEKVKAYAEQIDLRIEQFLKAKQLPVAELVDDATFLRRTYLTVAGRIPTLAEQDRFYQSTSKTRREELIAELVQSTAYVQHVSNLWADTLRLRNILNGSGQSLNAGIAYIQWVRDSLEKNEPYDKWVRKMYEASGFIYQKPEVGFYMRDSGMPLDHMAISNQVFLGTQMVCAQCHDHPFDDWTQLDYYQMAAFTNGYRHSTTTLETDRRLQVIRRAPQEERAGLRQAANLARFNTRFSILEHRSLPLRLPVDYAYDNAQPRQVIEAKIPEGFGFQLTDVEERQLKGEKYFAQWLTHRDNPRFTKVIVNRIWDWIFGIAPIPQFEDLRADTQAENAELQRYLEQVMRELNYDMRAFWQVSLSTRAFQREAGREDLEMGSTHHYGHALLRRMSAEQIWDSLVSLVRDDVDAENPLREAVLDRALTRLEWQSRTQEDLSAKEWYQGLSKLANFQKTLTQRLQDGSERVDENGRRLNSAQYQRRQIYDEADKVLRTVSLQRFWQDYREAGKTAFAKQTSPSFADQMEQLQNAFENCPSFGEAMKFLIGESEQGSRRAAEARMLSTLKQWRQNNPQLDRREARRFIQTMNTNFWRASELRQPAPDGHFLRVYGQSDRDGLNAANNEHSVLQALTAMNGTIMNQVVSKHSKLSRETLQLESAETALNELFLLLIGRLPDNEQAELLLTKMQKPSSRREAVWAILNSASFIYIP